MPRIQISFKKDQSLPPKYEVVQEISYHLLSLFPRYENEYLITVCAFQITFTMILMKVYTLLMLPMVLNRQGMSLHKLVLKFGVRVMLLRDFDQKFGLCIRSKLLVIALGERVIEVEIISIGNIGTRTLILRMSLTSSHKRIPFTFQRRQFQSHYV